MEAKTGVEQYLTNTVKASSKKPGRKDVSYIDDRYIHMRPCVPLCIVFRISYVFGVQRALKLKNPLVQP